MPDFAHAKFGAVTATATAAGAAGSNSAQAKGTAATTDVAQKIVKQVGAWCCVIVHSVICVTFY
jgi:La-related protein 7